MRSTYKSLIFGAILMCGTASAFGATAILEMVSGPGSAPSVQVKRGEATLSLKKGDELKPGDELTTDRAVAVDIRLEDKTLIRVGVNSSYRLEEDSAAKKIFHRLLSGIVRVLVPKSDKAAGGVKFEMRTADGTIGVRGTEFVVIKSADTQLKGLEGEVTFGGAGASFAEAARFVPVRGGFESRVKAGAAVPAAATAFDLAAYLKTLDSPDGPFKGLVARAKANVKARSAEPAKASVVVAPAVAPAPKASVKAALAKEAKTEAPKNDPHGQLFAAAGKGDLNGMKAAVKAGASVKRTFLDLKVTPLHVAVLSNNPAAVIYLMEQGADVNARDVRQRTPLMTLAADGGKPELLVALEKGGADETLQDIDGKTALQLATESAQRATDDTERAMYEQIAAALSEESKH